jgi:hypothetical protein
VHSAGYEEFIAMRTAFAIAILLAAAPLFQARIPVASGTQQEASNIMQAGRFWELIGRTVRHEADQDRQLEALRQVLSDLTAAEIEAFERAFHEQQRRAYSWDLWGAAYVMNGGASDDGFEYFQRWLISKGRDVFEAAIADPDSLATLIASDSTGEYEFEGFAHIAGSIWREKTGIDPLTDAQGRFPYTGAPPASKPSGVPFEEDADHLAKRYPKLWARFGMQ